MRRYVITLEWHDRSQSPKQVAWSMAIGIQAPDIKGASEAAEKLAKHFGCDDWATRMV